MSLTVPQAPKRHPVLSNGLFVGFIVALAMFLVGCREEADSSLYSQHAPLPRYFQVFSNPPLTLPSVENGWVINLHPSDRRLLIDVIWPQNGLGSPTLETLGEVASISWVSSGNPVNFLQRPTIVNPPYSLSIERRNANELITHLAIDHPTNHLTPGTHDFEVNMRMFNGWTESFQFQVEVSGGSNAQGGQ